MRRAQQVRPPQDGTVGGRGTADGDVVAATGARVAPVEHELLRAEPGQPGLFVESRGVLDQLLPTVRRVDVDLDDPGVRRHQQTQQSPIAGRLIALQHHRQVEVGGSGLDAGHQVQVVLQVGLRRQKDMQPSLTHFDAQGRVQDLHGSLFSPFSPAPLTTCS